jgi:putative membrane protein
MNTAKFVAAVAVVAALGISPVLAADSAQSFVNKAAVGGMFEVQSSELAKKMSKDPDVQKFADMMITDHGKANTELATLAKQEGLEVPAKLDKQHAAKLESLQKAGSQFDTPYIKAQLEGHQTTVKLFERYSKAGDNKALQSFAAKTLPTLRMHLDAVEQLGGRVGATK